MCLKLMGQGLVEKVFGPNRWHFWMDTWLFMSNMLKSSGGYWGHAPTVMGIILKTL